ncbi:hypothetical protein N7539_004535 [Penicillium diatomitis]|uniref:Uncharacterized protein n=1 Tax=Penicillium diatomitis TaxID=2819901 RepID=A0A9W9XDZ9_9EURO|nr:uncharacterized protein N7539_004535 [Penicillium diatomitis]KAJ5489645.1 hypothetical protein N7539_004535 [Penicillium diatomitis]
MSEEGGDMEQSEEDRTGRRKHEEERDRDSRNATVRKEEDQAETINGRRVCARTCARTCALKKQRPE